VGGAEGGWRELRDLLDLMEVPALIAEPEGEVLHVSETLRSLLACDSEPEPIVSAIHQLLVTDEDPCPLGEMMGDVRDVRAGNGKYRVRALPYRASSPSTEPVLIVAVERTAAVRSSEAELREEFGLTAAEVRVALLLMRGMPNAEIAGELSVSEHTARRHTEKVLSKLEVRSRAEVADRLLG
jgi:DNA-binding NarL/FixJ family response regulator